METEIWMPTTRICTLEVAVCEKVRKLPSTVMVLRRRPTCRRSTHRKRPTWTTSFDVAKFLLQFRNKAQDARELGQQKRSGTLAPEDQEMVDWDQEMKQYLYGGERKARASDRTKTPEEIAKEEAERLHALETRRLARMNGEFADDDDFSDVADDDDDDGLPQYNKKKETKTRDYPEALDDDSDEDSENGDNKLTTRFTADGLVQVDKNGVVVSKIGSDIEDEAEKRMEDFPLLAVGAKITANYRANEQADGNESWCSGTVSRVVSDKQGNLVAYDIEYDDGDFEERVELRHVRPVEKTADQVQDEAAQKEQAALLQRKRQKAKDKARCVSTWFIRVVCSHVEQVVQMLGFDSRLFACP